MSYRSVPRQALSMLIVLSATFLAGWALTTNKEPDALVVYCARDSAVANAIVQEFEARTGIPCLVVSDAIGGGPALVRRMKGDRGPRCDVFWDTTPVEVVRLKEQGRLLPLDRQRIARIPERFRDPDGAWCGFSAAWRVWWSPNGDRSSAEAAVARIQGSGDLAGRTIALDGMQELIAALAIELAASRPEIIEAQFQDWRGRGAKVLMWGPSEINPAGLADGSLMLTNSRVVAARSEETAPGVVIPYTVHDGRLAIPNVVAILKSTRRPEQARRFAEFLVSEATELRLASVRTGEAPLGDVDLDVLPEEMRDLYEHRLEALPLDGLSVDMLNALTGEGPSKPAP